MENNKNHILIVDDDDRIRNLLKDYLSENNYVVSTAENADQAKYIPSTTSDMYDNSINFYRIINYPPPTILISSILSFD